MSTYKTNRPTELRVYFRGTLSSSWCFLEPQLFCYLAGLGNKMFSFNKYSNNPIKHIWIGKSQNIGIQQNTIYFQPTWNRIKSVGIFLTPQMPQCNSMSTKCHPRRQRGDGRQKRFPETECWEKQLYYSSHHL